MKKFSITIVALSILALACEKEIDMDIPNDGTNLVVNGMLSPDSTFKVHVSGSIHILDNGTPPVVSNANVVVTDGGGNSQTLSHQGNGWYHGAGNPSTGSSYTINASSPCAGHLRRILGLRIEAVV